jgi:hypothetical protein
MNYQSIKQYCRMTICVCDYLFDKVIDQHRCWSSIQMTKSRSHYSDQPMTRAGPLLNHRGPAAVRDAVVLFSAMIVTVAAIVGVDLWSRPGEKDNDRILEVIIVFLPKTRITPTPQMTVAMKIAVVLLLLFLLLMVSITKNTTRIVAEKMANTGLQPLRVRQQSREQCRLRRFS